MDLIKESFLRLFPNKEFEYDSQLEYNRRLGNFNANIRLYKNIIFVNMNLYWKRIDDEIKIGLIQHLLLKILKKNENTSNIDLYHNFIKNVHLISPRKESDLVLEEAFQRNNEKFFYNSIEKPNLIWGKDSFRRLASYNFHNDTIIVSNIFKNAPGEVLDFLIYHELLHKHFKFKARNGRSFFHTVEFREAEQRYPKYKEIETEINNIIRSKKIKNRKWWEF